MSARYAIYFVPEPGSALYRFGAGIIGYDCYTGGAVPQPAGLPEDWARLVEAPRIYGFHATLKAPFRLTPGQDEAGLLAALHGFAATREGAPEFDPQVASIDTFAAIVPRQPPPALGALADACVTAFDGFRAPLDEAEQVRRLATGLSRRQIELFGHWGYPYVFDQFRFHMTLTGPLPADRQPAIVAHLARSLVAVCNECRIRIDSLSLVRQDAGGAPFRVLARAPMGMGR